VPIITLLPLKKSVAVVIRINPFPLPERIRKTERVVAYVRIEIPTLRIIFTLISEWFVRASEAPLSAGEVPCAEVIQPGFNIPFF
jgi:hypothetical protein